MAGKFGSQNAIVRYGVKWTCVTPGQEWITDGSRLKWDAGTKSWWLYRQGRITDTESNRLKHAIKIVSAKITERNRRWHHATP